MRYEDSIQRERRLQERVGGERQEFVSCAAIFRGMGTRSSRADCLLRHHLRIAVSAPPPHG